VCEIKFSKFILQRLVKKPAFVFHGKCSHPIPMASLNKQSMIAGTSSRNELLAAIDEAVSELVNIVSAMNEDEVNMVPYKDSWTAGQLLRHGTKSSMWI